MICKNCGSTAEEKLYQTFSYWFCPTCKEEVKAQMGPAKTLMDDVVDLYNKNEGKRYLYVSTLALNIDTLNDHLTTSCDLSGSTRFFGVVSAGVGKLTGDFDGVYLDEGSLTEDEFKIYIEPRNKGFTKRVDPLSMVLL